MDVVQVDNKENTDVNKVVWNQLGDKIGMFVFKLKKKNLCNCRNILERLSSKHIPFSLHFCDNEIHLVIYIEDLEKRNGNSEQINKKIIEEFTESSFAAQVYAHDFFKLKHNKISIRENLIELKTNKQKSMLFFGYILQKTNEKVQNITQKYKQFYELVNNTGKFSFVLSQSSEKNKNNTNSWSFFFYSTSYNYKELNNLKDLLHKVFSLASVNLEWELRQLTCSEIESHYASFCYYRPWIKHKGNILEIIDSILPVKKLSRKNELLVDKTHISHQIKQPLSIDIKSPLPSVKTLFPEQFEKNRKEGAHDSVVLDHVPDVLTTRNELKAEKPDSNSQISMNPRLFIKKFFIKLNFKETSIFEDNFDFVLRKNSFYILVKSFELGLTLDDAHKLVSRLEFIKRFQNKFLCIVVTDKIENEIHEFFKEYNILLIENNLCLSKEYFEDKLYDKLLYSNLPAPIM